jgi:hypothetical protein
VSEKAISSMDDVKDSRLRIRDLSCLLTCSTMMKSAHGSDAGSQQPTLRERPVAHAALLQSHNGLLAHAIVLKQASSL